MDILKVIVNSPAGYLDDAVLRLIALQLKKKRVPGVSGSVIGGRRPGVRKGRSRPKKPGIRASGTFGIHSKQRSKQ